MLEVFRPRIKAPAPATVQDPESAGLLRELRQLLAAESQEAEQRGRQALESGERRRAALHAMQFALAGPLLQAQLDAALHAVLASDPRYADPARLARHEAKVFSQFGEDGMLGEIFRRVGTTNRRFVEFGVEAGLENNTAYLLLQGWSGLWIESVRDCAEAIERGLAPLRRAGRLRVLNESVTAENVESLFAGAGVPDEPDLVSIDIDGNDYWVWRALKRRRPRVVVIEYNAAFPPPTDWVMPYAPSHRWDGTVQFGASLEALTRLGREMGYLLVGCCLGGANAFFVRQDLAGDRFAAPFTAANHYEPPRYYFAARQVGHPRCYEALAGAA